MSGAALFFIFVSVIVLCSGFAMRLSNEEGCELGEKPINKARKLRDSDPERAFYWLNKALEAGDKEAHLEIYKMWCAKADFITAAKAWTHLVHAGEAGSVEANLTMGVHLAKTGDFAAAEKHLSMAAKAGSRVATEELERLDAKRLRQQARVNTGEKRQSADGRQAQAGANPDPEKLYASALGLKGRCSKNDVKEAYRNLAAQYHPDKAAHLGPKLRAQAEEEMKRINEAFAYFKRKYDI